MVSHDDDAIDFRYGLSHQEIHEDNAIHQAKEHVVALCTHRVAVSGPYKLVLIGTKPKYATDQALLFIYATFTHSIFKFMSVKLSETHKLEAEDVHKHTF